LDSAGFSRKLIGHISGIGVRAAKPPCLAERAMPLVYRPARLDDLEQADALVVASINNLTERHGFGPMANAHPPNFQIFSLEDDPDGLWVAEDDGEIHGFAWSWICDDFWFLAQLFVSPLHQGSGIGNELLNRALGHAQKRGAKNKALITFSFNTVSQGLYMRHGLYPRFPIYNLSVPRDLLINRLAGEQLRYERLDGTGPTLRELA
jgi:ribosomal protein S18 acetylase RimI-like enzyme